MNLKVITRVGSLMVVFFFLPSIGIKIWQYLTEAPWPAKSWLVYLALGLSVILIVRYRWQRRVRQKAAQTEEPDFLKELKLLLIAKERLVKGEITLAEFKEIRQELKEDQNYEPSQKA